MNPLSSVSAMSLIILIIKYIYYSAFISKAVYYKTLYVTTLLYDYSNVIVRLTDTVRLQTQYSYKYNKAYV